MKWEYFFVLGATLFFPLLLSFVKRIRIWKRTPALLATVLSVSIPFWIWDVAVTLRGHWSFNPLYVVGIVFLGLPVEEWLFFIVIVFVSVFTWEALRVVMKEKE
jgi:lycopene cyclase domain-containing protein